MKTLFAVEYDARNVGKEDHEQYKTYDAASRAALEANINELSVGYPARWKIYKFNISKPERLPGPSLKGMEIPIYKSFGQLAREHMERKRNEIA